MCASRPWPGTTGTYLLSHALLALKVVVFAHCSAIHRGVNCVGFDPTGKKLVSCSNDRTVRIWDATTGEPIGSPLRVDGQVWCVNFSPDGEFIAAGYGCNGYDGHIQMFKAQTGEKFQSPLAGHRYVPSLCIECLVL